MLGQLQSQKECSSAAGISQCRTLTRTTTIYGEVESESTASDDGIPDVQLTTVYARDAFGNIEGITSDDAFGHHRASTATYEPEGIYPATLTNAADQVSIRAYDAALGVLIQETDPNQLVTTWAFDGFGRLALEKRPDRTQTAVTLSRAKDGGAKHDAWRVMQRSTTTGGADDTVELDSLGRAVRMWWHGPEPHDAPGAPPRLMQEIVFDDLGEHIARRSVPVREDTPEGALLFDEYAFDSLGREIEHATPWGLHVVTSYEGKQVKASDSFGKLTVADQDALGRPLSVLDATKGSTLYSYGPFGFLRSVTDPGGALTVTTRDAFGRVRQLDDPDRGTTFTTHDGFGELVSSSDAAGRVISYEHDVLGRPLSRVDLVDGKQRATAWTWDLAAHGLGRLQALSTPDGTKSYTYNERGQLETLSLTVEGEPEVFTGRLDYDNAGLVSAITYPTPGGAPPFVVAQDHDAHGYLLTARDAGTSFPYWHLAEVDDAGRVSKEVLGKVVTTERSYYADKQSVKSILTTHGGATVQELSYEYDPHRNLAARTDGKQVQHPTERFRYDDLDRLTCAYVPPVDVSTLGSGAGVLPSPMAFVPPDWDKDPFVQFIGGGLGGLCLGAVPFAGVGHQFLDAARVLPSSTPEARLGLAIGEMVGGALTAASGLAGEVGGGALSLTGIGALAGVPVIVVSTTAVVGGIGNALAGYDALASTGSGKGPRNGHLAEKEHPKTGVPFDEKGYPDFKAAGLVQAEVKITLTGTHPGDFAAANRAAGLKETPKGMTWHHHQDGTTMQLVSRAIHEQTAHTGGFSIKGQ